MSVTPDLGSIGSRVYIFEFFSLCSELIRHWIFTLSSICMYMDKGHSRLNSVNCFYYFTFFFFLAVVK